MRNCPSQKTYAFGVLLTGVLFLLLLASMSLIAVISSYFTRRSVEDLSERIVEQTLARVEMRIDSLLKEAMHQNAQGLHLLQGHHLAPDNFKALSGYFAQSLEVLQELTYIGFGREQNGDYIFAERLSNGTVRVREYVPNDSGQRVIRDWRWLGAEAELVKTSPWDGYDPRVRPFYQFARAARTNAWSETYQFWQGNERGAVPGVTFATPLYDGAGGLLGVLNADFDLASLCRFLAEVKKEIPGYAFVVERRRDGARRLIAHPDPLVLAQDGARPEDLLTMRDGVAAAFVQRVLSDETQLQRVLNGAILTFIADGREYFGSARRFGHPDDPPWAIGLIVPTEEVMATVRRNDRFAFWTGLSCLAITTILAVRIARRIAQPLRLLTREAQAIGRLELHTTNETSSRVKEVARLALSMAEMKTSLRSFQKFVPADVVRDIVTTATEARLGGQRATLTLFFSDVADFTTIAEELSPEALVEHVGEYLGEMSELIHAGGGTVDKFIGDGIMAFWGAPRPNPHHARDACRIALGCQQALGRLRDRWKGLRKPEFRSRVGLHTGPVIVGNIGSETRLNYTALGDNVNLTSRLEGLNKFYGTEILISAECVQAAGPAIRARPVDNVSVKGRNKSIVVYELLGWADDVAADWDGVVSMTTEAFALYLRGDFAQARERYLALLRCRPGDPVALVMEQRCSEFIASPRPTEWDTTFRMREK